MTETDDDRALRRTILLSILLFWTLHFSLLTLRMALSWPEQMAAVSLRRVPLTLAAAGCCWVIYRALHRFRDWPFGRRVVLAGALTVPPALFYGAAGSWLFYYGPSQLWVEKDPYSLNMFIVDGITWTGSFFAWAAVLLAISYNAEARDRERRLAQAQTLAHHAQLRALRYQINPHFLFNTLNSISSLIWEKDLPRAETMLVALSGFLRASLENDPMEDVSLEQEIALQRLYLDIEQVRYAKRLKVEIDIPPDLADARVPSLILQPLVENAIRYGVGPSKRETRLRISASTDTQGLVLEVEDNGAGLNESGPHGAGIGLDNVRERLSTRFGAQSSFVAVAGLARGFRVRLGLPLKIGA